MKSQQSTNAFVKETFMDLKNQLETLAKNNQVSIQNLETKFDRLADKQSGQPSRSLPRNTQPNPRGRNSEAYQPPQACNKHVNAVFTRSGKSYDQLDNLNDQQDNSENLINFDSDDEENEPTPQTKTQPIKPVKETPLPKPYKPKIPYPERLRKEKIVAQYGKFLGNPSRLNQQSVEGFMDDFFVFGDTFDKCLNNLDKMLQRYKDAHLVLNWEKCRFMVKEGIVLGYKASGVGLEFDKAKINVISKHPPPTNIKACSKNRPPMLNKENYVPWSSHLLRYAKSKLNRKLIYNSIINGSYVRRMIPELGDPNREVPVNETFHVQTDNELTEKELTQIEADDQAIYTILLGLPEDIYAAVDSCETTQEIWLRVQQMMKGFDIGI
uniref:Retrovirus-related Pol polyprotein from transposon opus n=1 Tax=Tanacetum cinerariifolium TaxID=118510 RepID=A0A6L2MSW7_TANCI|nr:retrovirus-related Pol polyprotein from transposon opus [Tanacetum cinerariifolium]